MTGSRAYLGRGWKFPIRPDSGSLAYVETEVCVEQAIGIVLETSPLERVMNPEFGCGLRTWVFEPNSPATHRRIEAEVTRGLIAMEPRITVEAVRAAADPDRGNVILIEIDYVLKRNNAFYNLVYPFYLNEGV